MLLASFAGKTDPALIASSTRSLTLTVPDFVTLFS
jgi:hypothetical protein